MSNLLGPSYIPPYQEDYRKLPWYERDFITYINHLKYREMTDDPDNYFKNEKVINFDIINNGCRGDPLKKSIKEHKTVYQNDFKSYPKNEQKKLSVQSFETKGMISGSREI